MGLVEKILKKSLVKNVKNAAMHEVISYMDATRSIDSITQKSTSTYILFIRKRNTLLNVISLLPINMIKKGTILNLFFLYFNVHVFVSMTLKVTNLER